MSWLIGIDEAGYGPNLGPFVMSAVAWRVPSELVTADLWHILRAGACRASEAHDGRVVVDDSKAIYAPGGLATLETQVVAALAPWMTDGTTLADYVTQIAPSSIEMLRAERWYVGKTSLPTCKSAALIEPKVLAAVIDAAGIDTCQLQSVAICPPRFNAMLDRWGSKGGVLAEALTELLHWLLESLPSGEPLHIAVDKHGGRNAYAAMLQQALPGGMTIARQEGAAMSRYEVLGLDRPIEISFRPRANSASFVVALASMASKYLRELCMIEFNQFWQEQVPNLMPTAGYPLDARRFFHAIRPALDRIGVAEEAIWRRK